MDGVSSSRVTVEYHDPSGIFPLVSEELTSRLPLRNLNWKASCRPLRSIDSIHIDLVPGHDTNTLLSRTSDPSLQRTQSTHEGGNDAIQPNAQAAGGLLRGRKHQIPGLHSTPYLKVYLLRCDDNETYKTTSRKLLREWLKNHTPPSQSNGSHSNQENHDAFEWLIVHVVLPNIGAADQVHGNGMSRKGLGRNSSTIIEKILADFNVSSKSQPDRVAQIRLQRTPVAAQSLPSVPAASPENEIRQEYEGAWNDLMFKLKSLILMSFDLRVSQYEEDIREREAQRSLPGWNFCTFFLLKEGLAKGFESVGLVEDALLGYDELSVGLDSVVQDLAVEGVNSHGRPLLDYTEDLKQQALAFKDYSVAHMLNGTHGDVQGKILSSPEKKYRDLIMSNSISLFDFRCYIFSRQLSLLLRIGNAQSSRSELAAKAAPPPPTVGSDSSHRMRRDYPAGPSEDTEDPSSLAELCKRALGFITSVARLMREDLRQGTIAETSSAVKNVIDNMVSSWVYSVAQQVLDETATRMLSVSMHADKSETSLPPNLSSLRSDRGGEQHSFVPASEAISHPARTSSLRDNHSGFDGRFSSLTIPGRMVFEYDRTVDISAVRKDGTFSSSRSGISDLATRRAELILLQRRALESVGKACRYLVGWAAIRKAKGEAMEEVSLRDNPQTSNEHEAGSPVAVPPVPITSPAQGITNKSFVNALTSIEGFRGLYERLSEDAVNHYLTAGSIKAADSVFGDLAALKFEIGDYAAAASYFNRVLPLYAGDRWNLIEVEMLKMHAQCLRKLQLKEDYVRVILKLLAKSAAREMERRWPNSGLPTGQEEERIAMNENSPWADDDSVHSAGYLGDLIAFSEELPQNVVVPLSDYFGDIHVGHYIRHYDGKDGFQLRLQFKHLLVDEITVQRAKVRLVSGLSGQSREVWLENAGPLRLTRGLMKFWLDSNVTTSGPFIVDRVVLEANKIRFIHDTSSSTDSVSSLALMQGVPTLPHTDTRRTKVFCYPRMQAFDAKACPSRVVHIHGTRSIEISLSSGWNDIEKAEVTLRSASAGLRLRTADVKLINGNLDIIDASSPGVVHVGHMPVQCAATLQIPYVLENSLDNIVVRLEIRYRTDLGEFVFLSMSTISIELPLDVNVHDLFKETALFSRFSIRTASLVPFQLLDVKLEGSDAYAVETPCVPSSMMVFEKQPACVTYKITRRYVSGDTFATLSKKDSALSLTLTYRCLDEDVLDTVGAIFSVNLKDSHFAGLGRLLTPELLHMLGRRLAVGDYESVGLLGKIALSSYEDSGWSKPLQALPVMMRRELEQWLRGWHERNATILLPIPGSREYSVNHPPRRITITVEVPRVQIVHTATLHLPNLDRASSRTPPIAALGQTLVAELRISHSRRWDSRDSLKTAAELKTASDPVEFVYEIQANMDVWLVGGQRRAQFEAREDEEKTFAVMLMPLKEGHHLLPTVEVRPVRKTPPGSANIPDSRHVHGADEKTVTCETDYQSRGEMVLVIPGVSSTSVLLDQVGTSGLRMSSLGSEPRGGGVAA